MTTPLFLLRCVQLDISIQDLDLLTIGMVNNMYAESNNDDYKGYVNNLRHACRGIIINNGNVLLCYESNEGKYIIPGGGQEDNESLEQCCERELLEETGMIVKTNPCYLEI